MVLQEGSAILTAPLDNEPETEEEQASVASSASKSGLSTRRG